MKIAILSSLLLGILQISNGQNNSFPITGNVGIGTTSPATKLHVTGHFTLEGAVPGNAAIFTGTGTEELNRYLTIINSVQKTSASGLKVGGVLVADSYIYANPGKNDLVVKGATSIGTASAPSGYRLAVAGKAIATEMKVQQVANWPDYVFKPSYKLMPLDQLERFIKLQGHLPEVAPAKVVEKEGIELGANQAALLKKIEELTLYIIEQNKELKKQNETIAALKNKVEQIDKAQNLHGNK
ncbi:MAG TPA: hypothetical protein VL943_03295 [Niabella sp.]|nr:hypothetical protein [Niabella sp.]